MQKNKHARKIIAFIMVIVTILTMLPASVLMALANTASGQIEVNNGSKYAVQWEYIKYPGYKTIYQYNRALATDDSDYTYSQGWYDILKKYVTTSSGGQKEPSKNAVPIYRLSRSNGDTNSDIAATAVSTVNIERYINLLTSAGKDGINLTATQASMIIKVLLNGFKQFTGQKESGDQYYSTQYYKDQLYFLATQVIIWEIQEGKRVGWGNSTSYRGTQTSGYPTNSKNTSRDSAIKSAYGNPNSAKSAYVYYWHDYYYTVYKGQFSGYPDYYNEILEACAASDEDFKYGTGNTPNQKFKYNQNTVYDMTYNSSTKRYEKSFVVTKSFLGETFGKYDTNDIVLPITSTKVSQAKKTVSVYSLPSTVSKTVNTFSSGAQFYVKGITKDGQFYYVEYTSSGADKKGYIPVGNIIQPATAPETTTIDDVTAYKNGFKVSVSPVSNATGYQVRYATRSDFGNAKTDTYSGISNTRFAITGRAYNTTYYVQARTYKTVSGITYYSDWTDATTILTQGNANISEEIVLNGAVAKDNSFRVFVKDADYLDGYQLRYDTTSEFTNAKTEDFSDKNLSELSITDLPYDTNYFIQVRSYRTVNGTKYYSDWSNTKTVITQGITNNSEEAEILKLVANKNGFTANVSTVSNADGYQMRYGTKADFSNSKTDTFEGTSNTSLTNTGRAYSTDYYVQVRTYKVIGDETVYSDWSEIKTVTTARNTSTSDSEKLASDVSVVVSGNKLTFRTSQISSETLKIRWDKFVPNAYNEATYFTNSGAAVRGYVSGGNQSSETSYFNLNTPTCTVSYKCSVCGSVFAEKEVPNGYVLTATDIPVHDENEDYYVFTNWTKGTTTMSTPAGQKITSDTTFVKNYTKNFKTINFWCTISEEDEDYVLIDSITTRNASYVTIPNTHEHSDYSFKYWSETPSGENANIESGKEYVANDLTTDYYAIYEDIYTVEYVCAECGEKLGTFKGTAGTSYTVPNYYHIHNGSYVDPNSGLEKPFADINMVFSRWDDGSKSGNSQTITESKTVYANYNYKNNITVESHLYNEDAATEEELDAWNSVKYKTDDNIVSANLVKGNNDENNNNVYVREYITSVNKQTPISRQFKTSLDDWHIIKYEIVDANGETYQLTNGISELSLDIYVSVLTDPVIKVYYEPDDVDKTVTINYVLAGQECNFNNDDNEVVMQRSFTVDYNELLDLANRKYTDETSGIEISAFEPIVTYNEMTYTYVGEYGYIQEDNNYHHFADDRRGTGASFPSLKNSRVTSELNIYVYYSLSEQGGITFNLYSSLEEGYDLCANNSTLKLYTSDVKVESSQFYITNETNEDEVNPLLICEADYTKEMKGLYGLNDGSNEQYPAETYTYKASIHFEPEELKVGKYYYFVYEDNKYDKYYYSPVLVGGVAWNGYLLEYNTTCDVGPILQTLQIMAQNEDGETYPASNATIYWQNKDMYSSTFSINNGTILINLILLLSGSISQADFDEDFNNRMNTIEWCCQSCEKTNSTIIENCELPLTCQYCGFDNEGLNVGVGFVKTDENGICSFYTEKEEYVFNIMNEGFTNLTDNELESFETYSERNTERFLYTSEGSKGDFVSESDVVDEGGNVTRSENRLDLYGLWELYGDNTSVIGQMGWTVCTVYQKLNPLIFMFVSDEIGLSTLKDGTINLDVYQNNAIVDSKKYSISDICLYDDELAYVYSYQFSYTPDCLGNYYFKLSINVTDYQEELYISPASRSYDYTGISDTLMHVITTTKQTKDLCASFTFDSELNVAKAQSGSAYTAGESANYVLDTYQINGIDVYYNPKGYTSGTGKKDSFFDVIPDHIPGSVLRKALSSDPETLSVGNTVFSRYNLSKFLTTYTAESGVEYVIEVYEAYQSGSSGSAPFTRTSTQCQPYGDSEIIPKAQFSFALANTVNAVNTVAVLVKAYDVPNGEYYVTPSYNDTYIYRGEVEDQQGVYTTSANFTDTSKLKGIYYDEKFNVYNVSEDGNVDYAELPEIKDVFKEFEDNSCIGSLYESTWGNYPNTYVLYNWSSGVTTVTNPYYGVPEEDLDKPFYQQHKKWIYPESDIGDTWEVIPITFTQTKTSELPEGSIDVEFVQPNANYNFGTDVISTFKVTNDTKTDYTDLSPLNTKFTVDVSYMVGDEEKTISLLSDSKDMVVPANKQNIVYYKWSVPTEEDIITKISDETGADTGDISIREAKVKLVAGGQYEGDGAVALTEFNTSVVEKEGFKLFSESGFSYTEPTADKSYSNVSTWQEYTCKDGEFTLVESSARLGYASNLLRPHEDSPTKEVRDNQWVTKSGYALSTLVTTTSEVTSDDTNIKNNAVVPAQTALVYYPEYNYSIGENKYESLVYSESDGGFIFNNVANANTVKSRHYIPIWYPNIEYKTQTLVSNMWTPAGMLSYLGNSNPIMIDGSLFDNYHTQQTSA